MFNILLLGKVIHLFAIQAYWHRCLLYRPLWNIENFNNLNLSFFLPWQHSTVKIKKMKYNKCDNDDLENDEVVVVSVYVYCLLHSYTSTVKKTETQFDNNFEYVIRECKDPTRVCDTYEKKNTTMFIYTYPAIQIHKHINLYKHLHPHHSAISGTTAQSPNYKAKLSGLHQHKPIVFSIYHSYIKLRFRF
ncbi:hypothetical protein FF38_02638 [Lucilia cuprina]|uniref:Uncharacterized protein n=1 Tax=Lucilia cuprina TaxID=7375 RepID=A0A0L0C4M3_LUCCU|nr:hypothetical protein FF38_02638 [Lucilia cuprina]